MGFVCHFILHWVIVGWIWYIWLSPRFVWTDLQSLSLMIYQLGWELSYVDFLSQNQTNQSIYLFCILLITMLSVISCYMERSYNETWLHRAAQCWPILTIDSRQTRVSSKTSCIGFEIFDSFGFISDSLSLFLIIVSIMYYFILFLLFFFLNLLTI